MTTIDNSSARIKDTIMACTSFRKTESQACFEFICQEVI